MQTQISFSTLKHFIITGMVCAVVVMLLADLVIGIMLGVIEGRVGLVASSSYFGSLLVAVFFIAFVGLSIATGNRFFAKRLTPKLDRRNIIHSSLLFALSVLALITYEFLDTTYISPSYVHEYPMAVLLMISIPIIKVLALPSIYYLLSMRQLFHEVA